MTVVINGSAIVLRDGANVSEAVVAVRPGVSDRGIAVAVNGDVVPKSAWIHTQLSANDKVEVLTAVAGG